MDYELVNNIAPGTEAWDNAKANLAKNNGQVITLTATPNFYGILQEQGVDGVNIIDKITGRTYQADQYRFFNDVPVPTWSKINMNSDGSIVVLNQGDQIAREYLFPNTRRAVQDIRYTNLDGTLDFIEEFASDGNKFSNLFYSEDVLQEIVFFNNHEEGILRYYFYDGVINYITIEDPKTHKVIKDYATLDDFLIDQVAEMVTADDTVTIHYMGIEMTALRNAKSHNILQMSESVLDENGLVRGNLALILQDKLKSINEVLVDQEGYQALKQAKMPLNKVSVI
ncbi:antitoxin component YwqK of YwqJK toxin-antitoxin module [Weissella uvarum]|uniref:hypothetical protein n=1 Tax=Weissella uvarum TaxID=1479233 RepID=UPI001961075B|nr:hypothetical protein [Weissella uvarum]MBM7616672.1 antitoxin component YwqK of YwqJK toxin-antitoxin module [Weissella uvarum]MCM0594874.1 hypothetical protein [Weissella uvarum]